MPFILAILMMNAFAQEEKSAFEKSLERDTSVRSEESTVVIKNVRYQKIEMNGGLYYVHFRGANSAIADVYCEPPAGHEKEAIVDQEPKTYRRQAAFVQAFHSACANVRGNKKVDLKLNPEIGLGVAPAKKGQ